MQTGEILLIKLQCCLRDDDKDKERRRILREIEDRVVLLHPWEEPLIVPTGIEIRIEEAGE